MAIDGFPERFRTIVGRLPEPGRLADGGQRRYETIEPAQEGFANCDGTRIWYAVWGERGPWLAFAAPFQIVHSQWLKGVVPYLSQHFRVITTDGRGNGRSDRPQGQQHYGFERYCADFVAVLDAAGAGRVALVGISAAAMTVLRIAGESPARVTHVVVAGGFAQSTMREPALAERARFERERMRDDWPGYVDAFMARIFSEPHSTKPHEDGVRYAWASSAEVMSWCADGWIGHDVREHARRVACPTLVVHGDDDRRIPHVYGEEVHSLVPHAKLLTIGGGGHVPAVRYPVMFARAVRDFVGAAPARRTWVRAMARPRRALFVSSAIGLGHVQRDLAIARELRRLLPDLAVDWFTVDPAARHLVEEGERVHPICSRLANESRHFENVAGEHDLSAFFALRSMDEIMARNVLVFLDLMEAEHYDVVIGDEAWDIDYHYHENPELKRQPFVFLTDFVGCLPMHDDERETFLCADRNADDIEHIERFPYLRDEALFVGNRDDVPDCSFGPGLPVIRDWTDRNFRYCGYCLPFDPDEVADVERLRAKHGYGRDERIVVASVGGTGVGEALLRRIAQAFVPMKRELPGLRMILVAGPRLKLELPAIDGLEPRPYVHNLFEHLACCDLALVQGGLSTCMELVAARRPFLSFPLRNHFEQCVHVRRRLANYGADRSVDYGTITAERLADLALTAMHEPVHYRPVERDGVARAARHIADVVENRAGRPQ